MLHPAETAAQRLKPALRPRLLSWFKDHQRDLPWRRTKDPFAIWVSEIMLQQTQVERVIGYHARFLERFPTVAALASATQDEVLSRWSGLGYYSRARNLHRAAQVIVERHGGQVPRSLDALAALPGFGRYTSGAVASIAFGLEAPLVDGNVARVFSRMFALDLPPQDRAREQLLWRLAETLVTGAQPGDFNQSLMELGATVCVPANPKCEACPVAGWCEALKQQRTAELPPPKKAAARKTLELAVAAARDRSRLVLARREAGGLFGGLWEMPCAEGASAEALRALLSRPVGRKVGVVRRTLTHRDLVMHVFEVELPARLGAVPAGYASWRWVPRSELNTLGVSSATSAAIAAL